MTPKTRLVSSMNGSAHQFSQSGVNLGRGIDHRHPPNSGLAITPLPPRFIPKALKKSKSLIDFKLHIQVK